MFSALAAIAPLFSSLLLTEPSAQALWSSTDATAVAPSGSETERAAQARDYFERGRFLEAAQEFEALAAAGGTKATEYLYNAAAARVALHHRAHATAHLERVLADPTLPPPQRTQAQALSSSLQRDLLAVPVLVKLPRDLDAPLVVRAEFIPVYASDRRPILEWQMPRDRTKKYRRETALRLDSGAWQLRIDDPRFAPAIRRVELPADAAKPVTWDLQPLQDPRRVRRFATGLASGGVVVATVGAGLLAGGQVRWSRTLRLPVESCPDGAASYPLAECRAALGRAGHLRDIGGALLGVGLGGATAGLTTLIKAPRSRRSAWIAEAVIGGVSLVGGAIVAQRGRSTFQAANSDEDPPQTWPDATYTESSRRGGRQALVGAIWAGLGGGLVLGAVTGLLTDRAGRLQMRDGASKLSLKGHVGLGQVGLVLSAAF